MNQWKEDKSESVYTSVRSPRRSTLSFFPGSSRVLVLAPKATGSEDLLPTSSSPNATNPLLQLPYTARRRRPFTWLHTPSYPRPKSTQQDQESNNHQPNDDNFPQRRSLNPEFLPRAACLGEVLFELRSAELVVEEAGEGNAVSEELKWRDGSAPDGHAGEDEEYVFEDPTQCQDQGGGFADLIR
jgi:hypothetical protein